MAMNVCVCDRPFCDDPMCGVTDNTTRALRDIELLGAALEVIAGISDDETGTRMRFAAKLMNAATSLLAGVQ